MLVDQQMTSGTRETSLETASHLHEKQVQKTSLKYIIVFQGTKCVVTEF